MNEFDELFAVYLLRRTNFDAVKLADCYRSLRQRKVGLVEVLQQHGGLSAADASKSVEDFQNELAQFDFDLEKISQSWSVSLSDARFLQFVSQLCPPELPPTPDDFADRELYAEGGLGQVWKVLESATGRHVALKVIKPNLVQNEALIERFVKEAKITARLEHPNIVPVYQFRPANSQSPPFYIMRLLQGKTLQVVIDELGQLEVLSKEWKAQLRQLVHNLIAVGEAVAFAHSRGVIHRDLKPANIIVSRFRRVFLVDWGLAKILDEQEPTSPLHDLFESELARTNEGQVIGTPQWMAPEQAIGDLASINERTDVFGLGAVLFHILHQRPPFQKVQGESRGDIIRRIALGPELAADPFRDRHINDLHAIAAKAMAKAPADRYASAHHLVTDLENWIADEPIAALPDTRRRRISRWLRRHPVATLTSLAIIMIVMVAVGFFFTNNTLLDVDELHTRAASTFATLVDRIDHETADSQILASLFAENRGDDDQAVSNDAQHYARFRPSLRSISIGSGDAGKAIFCASTLPNEPCESWISLIGPDRRELDELLPGQALVRIKNVLLDDKPVPRLTIAIAYWATHGKAKRIMILSFDPRAMFKDISTSDSFTGASWLSFFDNQGAPLFTLGLDSPEEQTEFNQFLARQKPLIADFVHDTQLEARVPPFDQFRAWLRRLPLPSPERQGASDSYPDVSDTNLANSAVALCALPPKATWLPIEYGIRLDPSTVRVLVITASMVVLLIAIAYLMNPGAAKPPKN